MKKNATFSICGKYRYDLTRQWDESLNWVMFIGLNPSTANHETDDPTIRRVIAFARALGYGGVVMCNCFAFISTDPDELYPSNDTTNNKYIKEWGEKCKDVIFAWGNFKVVRDFQRYKELSEMFPDALCLGMNKNGSPKHPLYCKADIQPVKFNQNA